MRNLLKPDLIVFTLAGFLGGFVVNWLNDYVVDQGGWLLNTVFALAAVFALIALWLRSRPKPTSVEVGEITSFSSDVERINKARRGMIVFVSLYRPKNTSGNDTGYWLSAADAGDYDALDLLNSNLAPAIYSIRSHAHRLKYCWLVGTSPGNEGNVGSARYIKPLIAYLQHYEGLTDCTFITDYSIPLDDDWQVPQRTRSVLESIFADAEQRGLRNKELVADFTGCPRSMTLGMIWACLDRNRDIQFAVTRYDNAALPNSEPYPILYQFEAKVEEAS